MFPPPPPVSRWEEDSERRERFFYTMLGGCQPPAERCSPDIVRHILLQHMNSPSVFAVFPMQVRGVGSGEGGEGGEGGEIREGGAPLPVCAHEGRAFGPCGHEGQGFGP